MKIFESRSIRWVHPLMKDIINDNCCHLQAPLTVAIISTPLILVTFGHKQLSELRGTTLHPHPAQLQLSPQITQPAMSTRTSLWVPLGNFRGTPELQDFTSRE